MLHIKAPVREPCSRENSCQHGACLLPAQILNPSNRSSICVSPWHLPGLHWAAQVSSALCLSAGPWERAGIPLLIRQHIQRSQVCCANTTGKRLSRACAEFAPAVLRMTRYLPKHAVPHRSSCCFQRAAFSVLHRSKTPIKSVTAVSHPASCSTLRTAFPSTH